MTKRQRDSLQRQAARLDIAAQVFRARVFKLSKGRSHHQACIIGGLLRGMSCDFSGAPCWCETEIKERPVRASDGPPYDAATATGMYDHD